MEYPPRTRLRVMLKVPLMPGGVAPFKMQKKLRLMRGPELYHNTLLHKQFGIIVSKLSSNWNNRSYIEYIKIHF